MDKLRCPECGSELELAIDVVGTQTRKIKKDGSLHKIINRCTAKPAVNSASYLCCSNSNCCYTYDTEHSCKDNPVSKFDAWIATHLEEISKWD